jgi:hypothetical protein
VAEAGDGGADAKVNTALAPLRALAAEGQPIGVGLPAFVGGEHQGAIVAGEGAALVAGEAAAGRQGVGAQYRGWRATGIVRTSAGPYSLPRKLAARMLRRRC